MTNLIETLETANRNSLKTGEVLGNQIEKLRELLLSKPKYYVERAEVIADIVEVDYCQEHELDNPDEEPTWFEDSIELSKLKQFIDDNDLRKDYIDGCDHEGNHTQTVIGVSMDEFLKSSWELEQVCKHYLEAGKERII